jgi:hypothetical protein
MNDKNDDIAHPDIVSKPLQTSDYRPNSIIPGHVAVGEKEDAFLPAGLPRPPDNLKRGVRLAGAGGHDQEDSVLALGDGFDRGVDGIGLIVARALAAAIFKIILQDDRFLVGSEAFPGAVA